MGDTMRVDGHFLVNQTKVSDALVEDKNIDNLDNIETGKKINDNGVLLSEKSDRTKGSDFIDYKEEVLKSQEKDKQAESQKEEKDISNTASRLTEEDYKSLDEEGITLEKYNLERLDQMITRIKSQRDFKEENLIQQKEKLSQKTEELREISNSYGADKELIEKLENANIPITQANVLKLSNTWEMAQGVIDLSDQSMAYIVKNGLDPTIENLYKAKYSARTSDTTEITDKEWESLKVQVESIMTASGLENTQSNIENGRFLIENNLSVNAKSLCAMADLNLIKQTVNKDMVFNKGIEAIAQGNSPESASLSMINNDRVSNIVSTFESITDEAIHYALKKGENDLQFELNYVNLKNSQSNVEEATYKGTQIGESKEEGKYNSTQIGISKEDGQKSTSIGILKEAESLEDLDIKTITVRRQLEEIRLKLTTQVGTTLIKNGLSIETASLSKIIDELKAVEDSYYSNLLKEGNINTTAVNTDIIKSSLLGMEELKSAPSYMLGDTYSKRHTTTVNELVEASKEYKVKIAGDAYETLMTTPRSDLGDSIKKAFGNVEDILSDMNLENNEANQRAVRILGYNSMEITSDSIHEIKVYDAQVNHMLKNFHPAVAIEMIRGGLNPLDMTVSQVNEKLDTIKEELGVTEEERFSKFLWKMDKNQSISEAERNSFIGIYRLLNTIEKTDGAALGSVVNAGQEISMKSLLTAVQSKKNKDMDYTIDDTFGTLSQYTPKNETITNQINTSFSNHSTGIESDVKSTDVDEKISYIKQVTSDIKDLLEPEKLQQLGQDSFMERSIETVCEELKYMEESSDELAYYKEQLQNLNELVKVKAEAIEVLKSAELPVTVANLMAAKDHLSKENGLYSKINQFHNSNIDNKNLPFDLESIAESLQNDLTDQETMVRSYETLNDEWSKAFYSIMPDTPISLSDVKLLQGIRNGMSFATQMSYKESYEIPIKVGENVTSVNVTFLKNAGDTGKVNITMDSSSLGTVMAFVSVKNTEANIFISSDTREGYETLSKAKEDLIELMQTQDLKIRQINYGMGNQMKDNSRYNNYSVSKNQLKEEEKVDSNTLYTLAKTVFIHVKEMELKSQA